MYDGMCVYRAIVSYSANDSVYVKIPSLLGNSVSVQLSKNIPYGTLDTGDQVLVAVEDEKVSNIHVVNSGYSAVTGLDGGSA